MGGETRIADRLAGFPPIRLGERVVSLARDRNITFVAAGVAYYALASLVPMLLLAFAVTTAVGLEIVLEQVLESAENFLTNTGQELLVEALADTTGRTGAGVVGTLGFVWGTLKLSRGLSRAFGELYEYESANTIRKQAANVTIVFGSLLVAVGVLVGFDLAIAFGPVPEWIIGPLEQVTLFIALLVALLPLYALLPPGRLRAREVLPGALVAATGWVLLRLGFEAYAFYAAEYQVYGILGALLLFITWLYIGALTVLIGAVVNVAVRESRL
jgi:membrane protein